MWTRARILLIGPLGTNFTEILSKIHTFSLRKIHVKMPYVKLLPFVSPSMCYTQWSQNPHIDWLFLGQENIVFMQLTHQPGTKWQTFPGNIVKCIWLKVLFNQNSTADWLHFAVIYHWCRLWRGAKQVTSHSIPDVWLIKRIWQCECDRNTNVWFLKFIIYSYQILINISLLEQLMKYTP